MALTITYIYTHIYTCIHTRTHIYIYIWHNHLTKRQTLLREISNIDPSVLNKSAEITCKIFLYGGLKFTDKKKSNILEVFICHILNTDRLKGN